ncbi:xylulokinase [Kaistia soli DSM 19436]|uniref:Xylulokinase n=1 Tax=Kaistia soli DSM 19436 TaxID=1122133 RepID=A0A1M4X4L7_9HYPH|nr:FGGY family carbohydrate kinase [Kaistia soli]SHE88411.1 xylulokinase [Kaistia soli DSM 19436]
MSKRAVVGIDIGTSSVKAVIVDRDARVLASGRAAYPTRQPRDGWSEQDPDDWVKAAIGATRAALGGFGGSIEAISLSGHMSAPVLVDDAGRPLGPCHTITDRRSAAESEAIDADVVAALAASSGNLPATHLILPKLLWWRAHHPDIWAATRAVLMPKDFVRFFLTGLIASDPTDSGNAMLFDPVDWAWSQALPTAAGIDPSKLAPLQPSQSLAGELTAEAAASLGLPQGVPVITGAADMAATLLAAGIDLADDVALTIGTSATVIAGLQRVEPALLGAMNINVSLDPGVLYAIGSHFGGGGALNWLASLATGLAEPDPSWFGPVTAEASAVPEGSEGLVFLPYLSGAGSPAFDTEARGAFLGLSMKHGRGHMLRAIVEGVTADVADSIDLLASVGARKRIVFTGGGSRIPFWTQLLADVTGLPVVNSAAADASALGAGLIAGVGIGWFDGDFAVARALVAPRGALIAPRDRESGHALRQRFRRARAARRLDLLPEA